MVLFQHKWTCQQIVPVPKSRLLHLHMPQTQGALLVLQLSISPSVSTPPSRAPPPQIGTCNLKHYRILNRCSNY